NRTRILRMAWNTIAALQLRPRKSLSSLRLARSPLGKFRKRQAIESLQGALRTHWCFRKANRYRNSRSPEEDGDTGHSDRKHATKSSRNFVQCSQEQSWRPSFFWNFHART